MTRDEVMSMTDEELRIEVEKLLGHECVLWPFYRDEAEQYAEKDGNRGYTLGPHFARKLARPRLDSPWPPKVCEQRFDDQPLRYWAMMEAVPDYPNDIAATWELVGSWKPKGFMLYSDSKIHDKWVAHFTKNVRPTLNDSRINHVMAIGAETAPKAITRAFILAMEAQDD